MTKPDMSHLPLCDCADHGATCRGRQEGKACMAHDDWYSRPAASARDDPAQLDDDDAPFDPLAFLRK